MDTSKILGLTSEFRSIIRRQDSDSIDSFVTQFHEELPQELSIDLDRYIGISKKQFVHLVLSKLIDLKFNNFQQFQRINRTTDIFFRIIGLLDEDSSSIMVGTDFLSDNMKLVEILVNTKCYAILMAYWDQLHLDESQSMETAQMMIDKSESAVLFILENFHQLGITDEIKRIQLAEKIINQQGLFDEFFFEDIVKNFRNFNITEEAHRIRLARMISSKGNWALKYCIEYLDHFDISEASERIRLVEMISGKSAWLFQIVIENFDKLNIADESKRLQLVELIINFGEVASVAVSRNISKIQLSSPNLQKLAYIFFKKGIARYFFNYFTIATLGNPDYLWSYDDWSYRLLEYFTHQNRVNDAFIDRFFNFFYRKKQQDSEIMDYFAKMICSKIFNFNAHYKILLNKIFEDPCFVDNMKLALQVADNLGYGSSSKKDQKVLFFLLKGFSLRLFSQDDLPISFINGFIRKTDCGLDLYSLLDDECCSFIFNQLIMRFDNLDVHKTSMERLKDTEEIIREWNILKKLGCSEDIVRNSSLCDVHGLLQERFIDFFELDRSQIVDIDLLVKYASLQRQLRGHDNALIEYLSRIKDYDEPQIMRDYSQFIISLLKDSFHDLRKEDPHLQMMREKGVDPRIIERFLSLNGEQQPLDDGKTLCVTSDWVDLFLVGKETDTCQSFDYVDFDFSKGLLGYVMNGKNIIFAVKNQEGVIISRKIGRLLYDKIDLRPVLYLENIYGEADYEEKIDSYATLMSEKIGVEHYKNISRTILVSMASLASFEYSDYLQEITDGKYTLFS